MTVVVADILGAVGNIVVVVAHSVGMFVVVDVVI